MTFDPQKLLDTHNGDPLAALRALEAQREEAQEGRDREGRAAQAARRERDAARSELDTAREDLKTAQAKALPEGGVVLTGEDAAAWNAVQEKGGREYLTGRLTRAEEADTLERTLNVQRASSASGVQEPLLMEWLNGRPLTAERRKDAEGKDVDVYGVTVREGDAEVFKPLSDFATFTALTAEHKPEPQRQQFPAQATGGGKPKAPDAVDALNSRLFGGRNASKEQ